MYKEKLNKLSWSLKEMAVHNKVNKSQENKERIRKLDVLFFDVMKRIPNINKQPFILNDNSDRYEKRPDNGVFLVSEKHFLQYHLTAIFEKEGIGYYEGNKLVKKALDEFISKSKSIAKVNFKKPEIRNDIVWGSGTGIKVLVSLTGQMILSQVVAFLYDHNTNKKYKLGTYKYSVDAEDAIGGLIGYFQDHRFNKPNEIFYLTRRGNGRNVLKTFTPEEAEAQRKYYKNLEIKIELVEK